MQLNFIESNSLLAIPEETCQIQSAIGSLLYYTRALDGTMLPTLNQIGAEQSWPTQETKAKLSCLLDYAAS